MVQHYDLAIFLTIRTNAQADFVWTFFLTKYHGWSLNKYTAHAEFVPIRSFFDFGKFDLILEAFCFFDWEQNPLWEMMLLRGFELSLWVSGLPFVFAIKNTRFESQWGLVRW